MLIVTTATLSLLLIGLLALTMTPGQGADPVAVESTAEAPTTRLAALEQPSLPMVTPLGDDGWAVTTSGAVGLRAATLSARLPSGDVVEVEVVRRDAESGITLVSLPTLTHGYEVATSSPEPSDTVLVHGADPRVMSLVDVADLDVAEGTPVLDGAGALVGICARVASGMSVMTVSTMPGVPATSTTVPRPTTTAVPTTATSVATTVTDPAPSTTAAPTSTTIGGPTSTPTSTVPPTTTAPATTVVSGGGGVTTAPG